MAEITNDSCRTQCSSGGITASRWLCLDVFYLLMYY